METKYKEIKENLIEICLTRQQLRDLKKVIHFATSNIQDNACLINRIIKLYKEI